MKNLFFTLALGLAVIGTACKNDSSQSAEADASNGAAPAAAQASAVPAGNQTQQNADGSVTLTDAAAAPAAETVQGPTTTISFNEANYNFKTVKAGTKVKHEFKFTNTGKEPLIISNCKASCGCTVPAWPKTPIKPGGTGTIEIEFDSTGKSGPQSKTVTVTANTNPAATLLTVSGEVTK